MALTSQITVASSVAIPSGYTRPTISGSLSNPVSYDFTTEIDVDGIAHASSAATGITALVAAVKSYVDGTLLPTNMKVDITGQTVTAHIVINSITETRPDGIYRTTQKYVVAANVKWA